MSRRPVDYHAGNRGKQKSDTSVTSSRNVTIEVPATLSEARRMLAASYRRAGYSGRQAALKVAELVGRIRSRDRRAA